MTRTFLAATALALGLAGAAQAMTADPAFEGTLRGYGYGADVDVAALTDAQVDALKLAIHGGDSAGEVRSAIRSILGG